MSSKIIFKDLSYRIIGVLYEVHNQLGSSYHERYYQRAIAKLLKHKSIPFHKEKKVDILINGQKIGCHFMDFVIDNKIILETKKGDNIMLGDIKQVLMYLKSSNYKLGILAYFGSNGVIFKRIINNKTK